MARRRWFRVLAWLLPTSWTLLFLYLRAPVLMTWVCPVLMTWVWMSAFAA